ncbi:hypothetical protein Btru_015288 [Bulinus truncatus]|nr:hypothetical protein Btru_015288 [Bulinus truncatus]
MRNFDFLSRNHLDLGIQISQCFMKSGQFVKFREFISGFSCEEFALLRGEQSFLKALVLLNFHEGHYSDAITLIKNGKFSDPHDIFEIWEKSHYRIAELESGRPLNAVGRCRIRKRFPAPPSIYIDGVPPPHRRLGSSYEYEKNYHRFAGQALDLSVRKAQSQPAIIKENVRSKPRPSRKMFNDQAVHWTQQSSRYGQEVEPYSHSNSNQMLPDITASPGTSIGSCSENIAKSQPVSPAQESVKSVYEIQYSSDESVRLESPRSEMLTPKMQRADIANMLERCCKPEVNYRHQGMYKGSNPLPQETVTLHYLSADVRYSWHPYRINHLFDICQQEMTSSTSQNPLVINNIDQNLKDHLNCPFPPNVSLIPVKRI